MYRQHLQKMSSMDQSPPGLEPQVVQRVASYPLMVYACDTLSTVYQNTKERNNLLRYTLETAETGVKTVATSAMPLVNKFEKPLTKVDQMACTGLDLLEERYPLITAPADKVYGEAVKPVIDYSVATVNCARDYSTEKVKAAKDAVNSVTSYSTEKVTAVKDYTMEKANGVKTYTCQTIDGVKQYSYEKLDVAKTYSTQKLSEALDTPYGKTACERVNGWLDITERCLDTYLPEEAQDSGSEKQDTEKAECPTPLHRAYNISNKARQRMYIRALQDLKNVQMRTKETLDKLHFTVDLIEYAKTNAGSIHCNVKTKFSQVWSEINADEEEAEKMALDVKENQSLMERRAIATARHLTLRIKSGVTIISSSLHLLPATVTDHISNIKNSADELCNSFTSTRTVQELPMALLSDVRERVSYLQEALSFVSDYVRNTQFLNWMVLEYDFDGMDLGDDPFEAVSSWSDTPCHVVANGIPANMPQYVAFSPLDRRALEIMG